MASHFRGAGFAACFPLLILLAITGSACAQAVEKAVKEAAPRVQSINISLTNLSATDANIEVRTVLENANPASSLVENLAYQLFYWDKSQWKLLAQGSSPVTEIKSNSSLEIAIPTTVKTQAAIGALWQFLVNEGSIRLKLTGSADAKVGPVKFNIPLGQEFTLSFSIPSPTSPLPRLPRP